MQPAGAGPRQGHFMQLGIGPAAIPDTQGSTIRCRRQPAHEPVMQRPARRLRPEPGHRATATALPKPRRSKNTAVRLISSR